MRKLSAIGERFDLKSNLRLGGEESVAFVELNIQIFTIKFLLA